MPLPRVPRAAAAGALLLALASPAAAQAPEADVRAALDRFVAALNALDVPAIVALHAERVTGFVPTARAERVQGRAAVARIYEAYAARERAAVPPRRVVPESLTVSADARVGVASFQVHDSVARVVRRRTFVFAREADGAWRIAHFHASDVPMSP